MSTEQILKVLKTERECIARQNGKCDRNCAKCDLCLSDTEILEVYDFLINGYEMLQNEGAKSYTIKCKEPLTDFELGYLEDQLSCSETFTASFEPIKLPDNMKAVILDKKGVEEE